MADVGAVYHLRYRSASSSSYKWEFVGGSQLSATQAADFTSTSLTYVSDANSPSITLPLAGDYDVTFSARAVDNTNLTAESYLTANTAAPSNAAGDPLCAMMRNEVSTSPAVITPMSRTIRLTALTATSLELYHRVSGGTGRYYNRSMTAVPVRVG